MFIDRQDRSDRVVAPFTGTNTDHIFQRRDEHFAIADLAAIRCVADGVQHAFQARIVHGDFRLDNMILAEDRADVRAVLDWELSTLGDPMADFSYLLIAWAIPASLRNGLAGADLEALGIPSVEETVDRYAAATGMRPADLEWLYAYNLFRLAAICQGIAGRVRDGTAASAHARSMAAQVGPLSEAAWTFAKKAGA